MTEIDPAAKALASALSKQMARRGPEGEVHFDVPTLVHTVREADAASQVEQPRWLVEIDRRFSQETGPFEDVGAESVEVESGCLVFRTAGRVVFMRAAGTWITVSPESLAE